MSKAPKEPKVVKNYTRKEVFFKVLPWGIIFTAIVAFSGLASGWTLRSDFDATIKAEVTTQVQSLTQK